MLNSVSSPDYINLPYSVVFPDFVNLPDLMVPSNFTCLSDFMGCSHSINGFHLIKAFDYIRVYAAKKFQKKCSKANPAFFVFQGQILN
jgi:hypothetical protein